MFALIAYDTITTSYLVVTYYHALTQYGSAAKYPAEAAIKILFFGVLLGSAGYFSGAAISRKIETIY